MTPPTLLRPASPQAIKEYYAALKTEHAKGVIFPDLTHGQKGVIIGALNKHLQGDQNRHAALLYLFGCESTKNLDSPAWAVLSVLCASVEVAPGKFVPPKELAEEAFMLLVELSEQGLIPPPPDEIIQALIDEMGF